VYYLFLKIWMLLGTGEALMRLPSVAFAIGAVAVTFRLGRRVAQPGAAVAGTLVLILSPLMVRHAQEVRMYSLCVLLTASASLLLLRSFDQPSWGRVAAWAGMRLLATITVPIAGLAFLGDLLVVARARQANPSRKRYALAGGAAVLLWVPAALALVRARQAFDAGWGAVRGAPGIYEIGGMAAQLAVRVFTESVATTALAGYALAAAALVGLAVFGASSPLAPGTRSKRLNALVVWGVLPPALLLLGAWLGTSFWIPRYLLPFFPFLALLVGQGLVRAWRVQRVLAGACVAVYLVAVGSGLLHYYSEPNRQDWRGATQHVVDHRDDDDVTWIVGSRPDLRLQTAVADYYGAPLRAEPVGPAQVGAAAARAAAQGGAIWLIGRTPIEAIDPWVPPGYMRAATAEFWGRITVQQLVPSR
jgi:4-amino-4-deoxy-L-arabinose transferase-like glycosyltransferase